MAKEAPSSPWLFRYLCAVALVVFNGRAMPLAFLPVAIRDDFGASSQIMGLTLAVYPFVALVAASTVSGIARNTKKIIRLHSYALWGLSFSMIVSCLAGYIYPVLGTIGAVTCIVVSRSCQGIGVSLYLAANTSLITRMFSDDVEYTIAMMEVMSGIGAQLGRVAGGVLYDIGGFSFPFAVVAVIQFVCGGCGLLFDEASEDLVTRTTSSKSVDSKSSNFNDEDIKWRDIITPRIGVAGLGIFFAMFASGYWDALLPQHLESYLGPLPFSIISSVMSVRPLTYMSSSVILARALKYKLLSFEVLLMLGATMGLLSSLIMAPEPFLLSWAFHGGFPISLKWAVQVLAFVFQAMGTALLFIPSLPLMQSEAREKKKEAVEKVAELFVFGMTFGEMMGPIVAGQLVSIWSFARISSLMATLFCLELLVTAFTYDPNVVTSRTRGTILPPSDGDAHFAVRRMVFSPITNPECKSAPAETFRRVYAGSGFEATQKPWNSVPADRYRRSYEKQAKKSDAPIAQPFLSVVER